MPVQNDSTNAKIPVHGVVGVLCRGSEFLMIQRAEGILAGGAWCFPGGSIEPGEASADAMVREMREEVHLEVAADRLIWQWTRPDGGLALDFWTAREIRGEPKPNPAEVQAIRWMTISQMRRLDNALPNLFEFLDLWEAGL